MCYIFINILKITVSARRSVIRLSVCYTFVLKFYFIFQQFLLVGVQSLILSPGAGYPRYATDTHTTGFWKLCNYTELSKRGLYYQYSIKKRWNIIMRQQ